MSTSGSGCPSAQCTTAKSADGLTRPRSIGHNGASRPVLSCCSRAAPTSKTFPPRYVACRAGETGDDRRPAGCWFLAGTFIVRSSEACQALPIMHVLSSWCGAGRSSHVHLARVGELRELSRRDRREEGHVGAARRAAPQQSAVRSPGARPCCESEPACVYGLPHRSRSGAHGSAAARHRPVPRLPWHSHRPPCRTRLRMRHLSPSARSRGHIDTGRRGQFSGTAVTCRSALARTRRTWGRLAQRDGGELLDLSCAGVLL